MNKSEKIKKIFGIILVITAIFLIINIRQVKAETSGCCEKLGDKWCQPATGSCDQTNGLLYIPGVSSCAETDICKLGTCIVDGQCSANYPKSQCEHLGGSWSSKPMEQIPDCNPGCCVTGSNCQFVTQSKCSELTPKDVSMNFDSGINDEQACAAKCASQDKGCCISGETYSYSTREQCSNLGGDFRINTYCSAIPESKCNPRNHTGCLDNDPYHLYSYDSCGNIEKSIQDCNYPGNEMCAKDINDQNSNGDKEEYVCRTIDCPNTYDNPNMNGDGGTRKNGESWCEYEAGTDIQNPDGKTGAGLDLPGTIQYKHYCFEGVEYAINCGDKRDKYCASGNYQDLNDPLLANLPDMSLAVCKENRNDCAGIVNKYDCEDKSSRDCMWLSNDTDKVPKDQKWHSVCVPLVPLGFTKEELKDDTAKNICKNGNVKIYMYDAFTTFGCTENCWALNDTTLKATNFGCMAWGDCGASPNLVGNYSKDSYVRSSDDPFFDFTKKVSPKAWYKFYSDLTSTVISKLNKQYAWIRINTDTPGGGHNTQLTASCKPWEIPQGGDDCWKCSAPVSEGGLLPEKDGKIISLYECKPYTCDILGTACKYIQNTVDGNICVATECKSILPPLIVSDNNLLQTGNLGCCTKDSEQKDCNPIDCKIQDNGLMKGYDITGNINEFKKFTFGIKTIDESQNPVYTKCSYSNQPSIVSEADGTLTGMDNMNQLTDGLAATQHNITFPAGYLASLGESETKFYIRCKSAVEDGCTTLETPLDYIIKLNIHTGPDTTVPIIEYADPPSGSFVAYNKDSKETAIYVNEMLTENAVLHKSGGCRWSDQNVGYDLMSPENATNCLISGMGDQECDATLTGINIGANTFYFACIDPSGNSMTTPFRYNLVRTNSLNISSFHPVSLECIPGNEINCYTNLLNITATTVGGAESGKASCTWSQSESGTGIPFFKTDSTTHEQPNLNFYSTGDYTYYATCTDIAENEAKSSVIFKINIDSTSPKIIGISHDLQYDKLKIIIEDENSVTCQYSNAEFFLPDGKSMGNIGNAFFADWGLGLYYIRCEDKFGNEMPLSIIHTSVLE